MEIDESFDELIDAIKASDIYKNYRHILEQVNQNSDINSAVNNIKNLQKKIVKEQHSNNHNILDLEKELNNKKEFLYNIPLYSDYIAASEELNELVNNIENQLQTYLNDLDV